MIWNNETITELRDLWTQGLSTAEIGRRLGVGKNAVIGKSHRLDLDRRRNPIHPRSGVPAIPHIPRRSIGRQPTLPPLASDTPSAPAVTPDHVLNLSAAGKGYQEIIAETGLLPETVRGILRKHYAATAKAAATPVLKPLPVCLVPRVPAPAPSPRSRQCEFISGDRPRDFVQCSHPSVPGKSWCETHYNTVFTKRWAPQERVEA